MTTEQHTTTLLKGILMAAEGPERMAEFYSRALGAVFEVSELDGHRFYSGMLGGLGLQIMPFAMAGIAPEERGAQLHQWRVIVPSLEAAIGAAIAAGGQQSSDLRDFDDTVGVVLTDPEGNHIEVYERKHA